MYCRNCGKQLSPQSEICMGCGVRPPKGDRFCNSCGVEVSPLAEMCVKCGAKLGKTEQIAKTKQSPKSKTTAVLLAVFLSFWTWLYTYNRNSWKFWLGLVFSIPSMVIFILGLLPYSTPEYVNGVYQGTASGGRFPYYVVYPAILILLVFWIWAIVDTASKNNEWYHHI